MCAEELSHKYSVLEMGITVNRTPVAVMAIALVASMSASGVAMSVQPTAAAWTDDIVFSAQVSAGSWKTPDETSAIIIPGPYTEVKNIQWFSPQSLSAQNNETCVYFEVEGTTHEPTQWSATVKMQDAPFYGTSYLWNAAPWKINGQETVNPLFSAEGSDIRVTGDWMRGINRSHSQIGDVVPVGFCGNMGHPPTQASVQLYSAKQSIPEPWQENKGCVVLTVEATIDEYAHPFWYGWESIIDLSELYSHFLDSGGNVWNLQWTPYPTGDFDFTATEVPDKPHVFALKSGYSTSLRSGSNINIQVCAEGKR